jgi:hypothetical protein
MLPPGPTSTVRFAALAVPASIARANIPAIAARTQIDLELFSVYMTSSLRMNHGRERNEWRRRGPDLLEALNSAHF